MKDEYIVTQPSGCNSVVAGGKRQEHSTCTSTVGTGKSALAIMSGVSCFVGDSGLQPLAMQPAMDVQLLSILSAYFQIETVKDVVSAMRDLEFIWIKSIA